jgi:hypothetical protein
MTAPALLSRSLRDLHDRYRTGLAPIWSPQTGLTIEIKVPAKTALAPERTRCKKCRSAFGDLIVLRMFCSYRCAGLPAPTRDVTKAPRECRRAARSDERGEWAFKQKFETAQAAQRYLKPGTNLYRCSHCFFLHIGNASPPSQVGLPPAPSGNGLLGDSVLAVLQARGQKETSAAAVAAAKRDVRAVFGVLRAQGVPLPV